MRFKLIDNPHHFIFKPGYSLHFLDEPDMLQEMKMIDWLEDKPIRHIWYSPDIITFEQEQDRTLFVLRFS